MQETIPKVFKEISGKYPDRPAQYSKDGEENFQPTSYKQLYQEVTIFASGLQSIGIKRGEHVGLISDNRKEWLISDLAILCLGAADVPRGCDSMEQEIGYILGFSDCKVVIAENEAQLTKILNVKSQIPTLKRIIVIDKSFAKDESFLTKFKEFISGVEVSTFQEIMEEGETYYKAHPDNFEKALDEGVTEDLATIIFTSGTTGEPKGVMLNHKALLNQVYNAPKLIRTTPEDIWLAVLPVWHSFERIMQYVSLGSGSALAYSKPIGKIMLADFQAIRPTWMASVPRIWSSLQAGIYRNVNNEGGIKKALFHFFVAVGSAHANLKYMLRGLKPEFKKRIKLFEKIIAALPFVLLTPLKLLGDTLVFKKIKAKLGGRFIAGISGGGALPSAVDDFFAASGILLLEGYGLTETAPVLGVRDRMRPVPGTVGPVFPNMIIQIRDENNNVLPPGKKGIVWASGPQIMMGYYKKPEETAKVLKDDGFFNTGDLGMLTWNNELKIMGRAKDTIVLLGGENIEPSPIEEKMEESPYIAQTMVVGQDQKYLGALVVPNFEILEEYCGANNISYINKEDLVESHEILELYNNEIQMLVNPKNGFKGFERVFKFKLLTEPFELGKELSQKQEIKRHVISEKYKKEIAGLF
jgi:long-chain acyl-CoA synthetase